MKNPMMYNADGYYDPTAGLALSNVSKQIPRGCVSWFGQPIYICTSRSISTDADIRYLERCCTFAASQGAHPIAPLLFYSQIFDIFDPSARKLILKWTRKWVRQASEIWIFDGEPPKHLKQDIQHFVRKGKVIRYFGTANDGSFLQTKTIQPKPDDENSEAMEQEVER